MLSKRPSEPLIGMATSITAVIPKMSFIDVGMVPCTKGTLSIEKPSGKISSPFDFCSICEDAGLVENVLPM